MAARSPKTVVRELVEAYNRKAVDELLDLYQPDAFFWDPFHRDGVRGRDAIRAVVRRLFDAFPDEQMSIVSLAADDQTAVAEFRSTGTSASGAQFELEFTEVYEIAGGLIESCRVYIDPEQLPA